MKQCRTPVQIFNGREIIGHDDLIKFLNDQFIRRGKRKIYYCNYPISFDIETSSFYDQGEKVVITYLWCIAVYDQIYYGRTWQDFMYFMKILSDGLQLNDKRILVIYVHNLSYEFQFMRKLYDWDKVFALSERKVIYARTVTGIEFRCSYLQSNSNLAMLGDKLRNPIPKLVGDLDYNILHTPDTPLTDQELQYAYNDVLIVTQYIKECIEDEGNIYSIPMTKTGYVRRYMKTACLYGDHPEDPYERLDQYLRYTSLMKRLTLSTHEYMMLKRAFAGGFTHANIFYVGQTLNSVTSQDLTSSYPTVMIADLFPMGKGKRVTIDNEDTFKKYVHKYCCLFDIRFYNIRNTFLNEAIISSSKCYELVNPVKNNGRIESADVLLTTITEQDFFTISKFYEWDHYEIGDFYIYRRGYLPTPIVRTILDFYKAKTELKGLTDDNGHELKEYSMKKEMLNSCYGMTVTDICRNEILYDDEWDTVVPDYDEVIEKYNTNHTRFLYYPWGVWVTAHARRNILEAIYELGDDYVYSDTDSVKYLNESDHGQFFTDYYNRIIEKLKKALKYHGISEDEISPANAEGVRKPMGVFTHEGVYKRFKTLGAKRYMYEDDDGISITVAGLGKTQGGQFVADQADPFEFFNNDMYIPAEHTGKLTHTYMDDVMEGDCVDYLGNKYHYKEYSGVHLSPCDFSLSMTEAFLRLLGGLYDGDEAE